MLEAIKDCKKHIVCYADPETGFLESKYKKQTTNTVVPIGGEVTIIRDDTKTSIKRISAAKFEVHSVLLAA